MPLMRAVTSMSTTPLATSTNSTPKSVSSYLGKQEQPVAKQLDERQANVSQAARTPLQERSSNAMMLAAQNIARPPTVFTATEMSYESHKTTSGGKVAPIALKRAKTGPYVTPRLAANVSPAAATSSLDLNKDSRTPVRSSKGTPKDDVSTPVKNFLGSNVTPRSGTRTARVNSPASTPGGTPSGTPSNSRPTSTLVARDSTNEEMVGGQCFGIATGVQMGHARSGSVVSVGKSTSYPLRGISPDRLNQTPQDQGFEASPMFFHASEVKTQPPKSINTRPGLVQTTRGRLSSGSAVSSTSEQCKPTFYHANGMPETASGPKLAQNPTSVSSRPSPRLANFSHTPRSQTRSASPLKKDYSLPPTSAPQKRSPQQSAQGQLQTPKSRSPSLSSTRRTERRASSRSQDQTPLAHKKNQSTSSVDSTAQRRSSLITVESTTSPPIPSPQLTSPLPTTEPAPFLPPLSITQDILTTSSSPLTSPTRGIPPGSESKLEELNRLAANARRERKVLDLEISNSSLLAINRTLEREMRKQTAELRRYRRLTSAGRISLPRRSTSSRFSALSTDDGLSFGTSSFSDSDDLSGLSESPSEDSSTFSGEDNDLSLAAQAAKSARQRARDEKRLRLDLSKHQELLVESQKMNQSLKRCVDWTEELIAEGKKALAYQVRVSDVEVGGRVLGEEEVGVELDVRRGLLSPGLGREGVGEMDWGETFGGSVGGVGSLASPGVQDDVDGGMDWAVSRRGIS
ncbi:MAG: hypothetical protein MMC23_000839 [Stictis urceolatum]|nr:hypothetical protein [Stictis urceolata]